MITLDEIERNPSARDTVFIDTLNQFNQRPIKILEIGCLRNLNSRAGDGWSSIFWAMYVTKFGGSFSTSNTSSDDISVCKGVIDAIFPKNTFSFSTTDGKKLINNEYDLIYLDGGDDPQETLDQFNMCDLNKTYVLIDDYHTKGSRLPQEGLHTRYEFSNDHRMALYHNGSDLVKEVYIKV